MVGASSTPAARSFVVIINHYYCFQTVSSRLLNASYWLEPPGNGQVFLGILQKPIENYLKQ